MACMETVCLIVGAGPTGLALATELQRSGVSFRLIDTAMQGAQYSQALVLQARTLEQFDRYGLADRAVAGGIPIRAATLRSDGAMVGTIDLTRIPGRFPFMLMFPQNETEALLIEHLRSLGVEAERGMTLRSFRPTQDGGGVLAQLQAADGSHEEVHIRWLVGCDGAHSTVRHQLGVRFEGDTVDIGFSLGDLRLVGPDVPTHDLHLYWHRGGDVLFLARLPNEAYRVITAFPIDAGAAPPAALSTEYFNTQFDRFGLRITAESADWLSPFRVNERQVSRYSAGNVFLAGDAAHVHSPVGGQGMNTGIQDAANLGWKLGAVAHGAPESLLESYNAERHAVGKAVLRGSAFGLRAATTGSTALEHLRDFVAGHLLPRGFVQDAAARAISETGIEYRHSEAVHDDVRGGTLHAGDRLPDSTRQGDTAEERCTLHGLLRDGHHLLLAIDVPEEMIPRDLRHTSVAAFRSDEPAWSPPLAQVLGTGPLLFLIRPDGYVGFRSSGDGEALRSYARRTGLA